MKTLNHTDKAFSLILLLSLVFWIIAKLPLQDNSFAILFGVVYEISWLIIAGLTVVSTLFFLIKWVSNKFSFTKIYFYGFLLGLVTLAIMRFIY